MQRYIKGTGTALVTPFTRSGGIDYDSFKRLIELQLAGGVEMLVPLGSTGENPTINNTEREEVLRFVIEYVNKRALIIAGTGTNDTRTSIENTRIAMKLGADACLVVTPFYNKPTPIGLFEHFKAVGDVGLPMVLYNVPGRTGLNMTAETTLRCAEIRNVIAIKESSADLAQCMEIIRNAPQDFVLLSGEDNLAVPLISVGAQGVISVAANVVPGEFSRMIRFALSGHFEEAKALHYELLDLMKVNFIESNPGPVKAALAMMGIIKEEYRMPIVKLKPDSRKKVKEVIEQLDSIVLDELSMDGQH